MKFVLISLQMTKNMTVVCVLYLKSKIGEIGIYFTLTTTLPLARPLCT